MKENNTVIKLPATKLMITRALFQIQMILNRLCYVEVCVHTLVLLTK
jgi:hypothetical protein